MKREILFRGKRVDNGRWVEGSFAILEHFYYGKPTHYILTGKCDYYDQTGKVDYHPVEIDPETVGQYTGLKDKNGVPVFEGDIVEFDDGRFVVEYFDSRMGFGFSGLRGRGMVCGFTMTHWEHLKIIGNIHDNPELMEVQHE